MTFDVRGPSGSGPVVGRQAVESAGEEPAGKLRKPMGMNEADRLKGHGIAAKKASITRVPLGDVFVEEKGPLAHPRWNFPIDEALVAHIMANGVPGSLLLREGGAYADGYCLELVNGARRTKNGLEAERRLRETAPRQAPLTFDKADPTDLGRLYANVDLFVGSDSELLLARLAANSEPGKLPDSAEVLARTVIALAKVGCEDVDSIVAVMPRGVGRREVQALGRWGNLTAEARAKFVEFDAPVGILAAVLDGPREEQLSTLEGLLAAGVRTGTGATRRLNAERSERSGEPVTRNGGRRWAPKKLAACAKLIAANDDDVDLADKYFANGFAAALKFAAGEKTGKLPKHVAKAIKSVGKGSSK